MTQVTRMPSACAETIRQCQKARPGSIRPEVGSPTPKQRIEFLNGAGKTLFTRTVTDTSPAPS